MLLDCNQVCCPSLRWDSGETYLILDKSMSALVDNLRQGVSIRTGFPITAIKYDHTGAVLSGPNGVKLGARKVIITAPLAVLQAGKINFTPGLPASKAAAIKRLRMGNAAKVNQHRVYCEPSATRIGAVCWRALLTSSKWVAPRIMSSSVQVCTHSGILAAWHSGPIAAAGDSTCAMCICGIMLVLFDTQIIIAFNQRFWPEHLYDVICTHTFVPEFWMTQHEVVDEQHKSLHAVVGKRADLVLVAAVRRLLEVLQAAVGWSMGWRLVTFHRQSS